MLIADDDTGDAISLVDDNDVPLYALTLEIMPATPANHGNVSVGYGSPFPYPYYDYADVPVISATLADYIAIVGMGALLINIPKSVMTKLCGNTYDVFLTIEDVAEDDARQLLIGRLPVLFGGRNT